MRKPSLAFLAVALPLALCAGAAPAFGLSEIQREDLPAPGTTPDAPAAEPVAPAPADEAAPATPPTDPAQAAPAEDGAAPDATGEDSAQPGEADTPSDPNRPELSETGPLPEVFYDMAALPEPVRRMHDLLLAATRTGDVEKLRPLVGTGEDATQLSLGDVDGDVIEFLKQSSGDGKGLEILAILEEVLSAGYVHLEAGTPEELYVWPYFFAIPLDRLTDRQQVELFKIVTSGDVEEMKSFGAYIFYRIGITPEGRWAFFLAGD